MSDKLTKIEIITKGSKLEDLKDGLNSIGITGMTVTQVLGCGMQKGKTEFYRGNEYKIDLLPKIKVEVVVSVVPVKEVVRIAKEVLGSNEIGSGKIFIYEIQNAIRIRTGEEGTSALN
ncbi:P-II family nitrogen regulator [Alkalibacter saccharofermentans]|uniref:Nitrogen regulatory protein P-II family n=1 Tax=Alkalibacter saccharofermentans DSM 14828 TaxID=1120975 RepID=A0A1M4YWT1_9FIRM|nr:P-II family nitrogen regulator [Alkalibacter saccharofermentans]SHF09972.1 nitrogen regulatory protein P-II family [Alkalibacter saccharofermentans DSM 14828]